MGISLATRNYSAAFDAIAYAEQFASREKEDAIDFVEHVGVEWFVPRECFLISTLTGLIAAIHEFVSGLLMTICVLTLAINDENIKFSNVLSGIFSKEGPFSPTGTCLKIAGLSLIGFFAPTATVKIQDWLDGKTDQGESEGVDNQSEHQAYFYPNTGYPATQGYNY